MPTQICKNIKLLGNTMQFYISGVLSIMFEIVKIVLYLRFSQIHFILLLLLYTMCHEQTKCKISTCFPYHAFYDVLFRNVFFTFCFILCLHSQFHYKTLRGCTTTINMENWKNDGTKCNAQFFHMHQTCCL
jgi:hypothetical protein